MIGTKPPAVRLVISTTGVRQGRFGPTGTTWVTDNARDRAASGLREVLPADGPRPTTALAPRLKRTDAFLVIAPECNHRYPTSVETAIDKPAAFVCAGGGLRAVAALRHVSEVHAPTIDDVVGSPQPFGADGSPDEPCAAKIPHARQDPLERQAPMLRDGRHRLPDASVR